MVAETYMTNTIQSPHLRHVENGICGFPFSCGALFQSEASASLLPAIAAVSRGHWLVSMCDADPVAA